MHYILVKSIADAALTILIVLILVFLGIGPKQVAKETLIRDIGRPLDHFDVAVLVELLTETTVHAQDLVIYESCDGELFEDVDEFFEKAAVFLGWRLKRYFRFSLPFEERLIEAVDVRERVALVIASQQEEVLGVLDLESQQQQHGFNLHGASSLIVTEE